MNIDFFAVLAKRIANKNYSRQSIEHGIEVLEFARQLFPGLENQRRFDWEVAHLAIQISDLKEQMKLLSNQRKHFIWGAYNLKYNKPLWNGAYKSGDTILMVGEGGIGDEIFAAKFSYNFKTLDLNVVFATNYHPSRDILSRVPSIDKVIHIDDIPNEIYDYWISAGESAGALDLNQEDVPNQQYLFPSDEYLKKWENLIPKNNKLKVGVRWSGSKNYEVAAKTIIPFTFFDELTSLENVEFYSIQRDDGVEDILPNSKIIPLHDKLKTWDDTLAAIYQLDLVISSSTCIPIISAGLNKKTWVVVPTFCYCLWVGDETSSYWFGDNFKVYRQSKVESWKEPFEKIKSDLYE